jgi:PAS domain-containing protein
MVEDTSSSWLQVFTTAHTVSERPPQPACEATLLDTRATRFKHERKRTERALGALGESEAIYRATFDGAPVGIGRTDLAGRFLRVNRRLCEHAEFIQKPFSPRALLEKVRLLLDARHQ